MGDVAKMMLDGTLCECCGSYITEGEANGFPRKCSDCKSESIKKDDKKRKKIRRKK